MESNGLVAGEDYDHQESENLLLNPESDVPLSLLETTVQDNMFSSTKLFGTDNREVTPPTQSTTKLSPESPEKEKRSDEHAYSSLKRKLELKKNVQKKSKPVATPKDAGADYFAFMKKRKFYVTQAQAKTEKMKQHYIKLKMKILVQKAKDNNVENITDDVAEFEKESDESDFEDFMY